MFRRITKGFGGVIISNKQDRKKCPNCNEEIDASADTCPKCSYDFKKEVKTPRISKHSKFKRNTKFLSNYDFNIKVCPNCNSKLLLNDSFCYSCGADVVNVENAVPKPKKTRISKHQKFKRTAKFLSNYDFNIKTCPKCSSKLLKDDLFCYNCGNKLEIIG